MARQGCDETAGIACRALNAKPQAPLVRGIVSVTRRLDFNLYVVAQLCNGVEEARQREPAKLAVQDIGKIAQGDANSFGASVLPQQLR
jgi:hypothetical protein